MDSIPLLIQTQEINTWIQSYVTTAFVSSLFLTSVVTFKENVRSELANGVGPRLC